MINWTSEKHGLRASIAQGLLQLQVWWDDGTWRASINNRALQTRFRCQGEAQAQAERALRALVSEAYEEVCR